MKLTIEQIKKRKEASRRGGLANTSEQQAAKGRIGGRVKALRIKQGYYENKN